MHEAIIALAYDEATGQTMVMDANGNSFVALTPEQIGLACLRILHDPSLPQAQRAAAPDEAPYVVVPHAPPRASRPRQQGDDDAVVTDAVAKLSEKLLGNFSAIVNPFVAPVINGTQAGLAQHRQNKARAEANKRQAKRTEPKRDRASVLQSRRPR